MTTPRRTDYSREESLRRLGPEVIAEIDRIVAEAPPLTAEAVQAIQTIWDQIDARKAREAEGTATRVASEAA